MPHVSYSFPGSQSRPILAAIQTISVGPHMSSHGTALPFITISRQAGAGAMTLAHRVVDHLNAVEPSDQPWTAWDKELVQKIAEEHHISRTLVESLEERGHSWLEELLGGLCVSNSPDSASELRVFWKTAVTVRAIAHVGRCTIVGLGGAFITRNMPGGIHIRLVAPEAFRIRNYASIFNLSLPEAAARVKELDRSREAFYRRHWPGQSLGPEAFTATFDTSAIGEWELVKVVAAMVPSAERASSSP